VQSIFDAFEQVDSGRSRRFGGTGLGTTIAKALAEFMGGTISVQSQIDVGSRFDVDLPMQVVSRRPVEDKLPDNVIVFSDPFVRHRARVRPMRVLVADDQSANLMVMRRLLEKAGHKPHIVNTGDDVLSMIEAQAVDAAIIDLHMPGLSGLEVIKQARFIEAGRKRTPFVVLTADATVEARTECERAGAYAFLTKPLAIDKLLDKLAEIADGSQQTVAVGRQDALARATSDMAVVEDDVHKGILGELREMGLGDEFIQKFVVECARDIRKCIADLEGQGAGAKWDSFRDTCHALKGAASNMGAVRLAATASEGMDMPPPRLRAEWQQLLQTLRRQLEDALLALRERGDLPAAVEMDGERG
jgi:two-component system sensor histidine kinase RpfC